MLFATLLLLQTAPVAAPAPVCPATDVGLPGALRAWTTPAGSLGLGRAVVLQATTDRDITKNGVASTEFTVTAAGKFGIALDQPGWIDVLAKVPGGGFAKALQSVAHGHGPQCSTIRKIVRFDLKPGVYRLYLTGLSKPAAKVMLITE